MNILLADSRGGGMSPKLPGYFGKELVKPGATVKLLTSQVKSLIPSTYRAKRTTFVYVMAGINDACERVESPNLGQYRYREVIFVEDPHVCANKIIQDIRNCALEIKRHNATPVFATITKANLSIYNQTQLNEGSTRYLHQADSYGVMQEGMNTTIDIVNGFIKNINRENQVSTPFCHNAIIQRRGRKGRYRINQWKALRDGIHGTWKTRCLWAKALQAAMDCNSKSDEVALLASPKRSWKNEKRQKND